MASKLQTYQVGNKRHIILRIVQGNLLGREEQMAKPEQERRVDIRIPILSERIEFVHDGKTFQKEIGDISKEGIFIKSEELLPPHSEIYLKIQLPGDLGFLNVPSTVRHVNWCSVKRHKNRVRGFGIHFLPTAANLKKILAAYVIYLRNKQIINVSKKILEDFFGPQPQT